MKVKPISKSLLLIAILVPFILLVSEEPGRGIIQTAGLLISGVFLLLGLLLSRFWKEQQKVFLKIIELVNPNSSAKRWIFPLLVFIWPFLIFWQLVIPTSFSKTIGNDFIHWYFTYKVYLMANLSQSRLPLWSPAEAAGFPFFSSPLTQTFYPLNFPYALYARLQGGISILSYQIFTIAGISIFALGIYTLLRTFKLSSRSALVVSLILPISFKLIETGRFPNAVHTAAWYPWILFLLTRLFFAQSKKAAVLGAFLLALLGINIMTAGYPYFVYYLLFLIPPYLVILAIPSFRKQLFPEAPIIRWKFFLGSIIGAGAAALLILWPYLLAMKNLLGQTTNRTGQYLVWSTGKWSTTLVDFIGSAIFPPAASSEGWFYFGIFSLLLILFFIAASLIRNSGREGRFSRGLALYFLLWISAIAYLGWDGNETPLNFLWILFWKYLPGFSSLRVWSRINILLLPILSILLAYSILYFERLITSRDMLRDSWAELSLVGLVSSGILLFQYLYFRGENYSKYWSWIDGGNPLNYLLLALAGIGLFFGLILYPRRFTLPTGKGLIPLYLFLVIFCIFDARGGQISPWIWMIDAESSALKKNYGVDLDQGFLQKLTEPRVEKSTAIPLNTKFNSWASRNTWHFQRYVEFLEQTDNQERSRNQLLGIADGTRLYFSEKIDYTRIDEYLEDAARFEALVTIDVLDYSGDQLHLQVDTSAAGQLSFIDNWDPDWQATVNGEEIDIQLLFGTFKSIHLLPGSHLVIFSYSPRR